MILNPEEQKERKFINELLEPSEKLAEAKSEIKKSPNRRSDLLTPTEEKSKFLTQEGKELFLESN